MLRFLRRVSYWVHIRRESADLAEEMEFHQSMRRQALEQDGAEAANLDTASRRAMGNQTLAREDARRIWVWSWLDDSVRDTHIGLRTLWKSPGFTATAALTLALGVGVNATMFSLVDHLMFKTPAHVKAPEQLIEVGISNYSNYLNVRDAVNSMDLAAYMDVSLSLGRGDTAQPISAEFVSHNYFDVLGATPALGRWFGPDEESPETLSPVTILSDRLWRTQFEANVSVIGESIWISNGFYTIVGIAPPSFTGILLNPVDLWLPLSENPAIGLDIMNPRGGGWLHTVGRIRDDFTLESVRSEASMNPQADLDVQVFLEQIRAEAAGLAQYSDLEVQLFSERQLRTPELQDRAVAWWLAGAAGVVLLIACANVCGLLLVRGEGRRNEIGTRARLGAGRLRLVRQLLMETLLLGTICGSIAVPIVLWVLPFVRQFFVAESWRTVLDHRVLAVTATLALGTALLCGLVPVIQALRVNLVAPMRSVRTGSKGSFWARRALHSAQLTLTLVLLVATGLFVRSLERVREVDLGFDPDEVLVASPDLDKAGYSVAEANEIYRRMLERVESIPGVEHAGLNISLPVERGIVAGLFTLDDGRSPANPMLNAVTPDYLSALGTALIEGRGFKGEDGNGAPPVVILPRSTAEEYWPGERALGRCLIHYQHSICYEVVGVVEDSRWQIGRERASPALYFPLAQITQFFPSEVPVQALFIRAESSSAVLSRILAGLRSIDPDLPYVDVASLWTLLGPQTRSWRLGASMFGLFGLLAAILAGVGVYGTLAYSVRQRAHEIGIRMAIGARRSDVIRFILMDAAVMVGLSCLLGTSVALILTRFVEKLLIVPTDSMSFLVAILIITTVATLGTLFPAIRASRVDPAVAVRHDRAWLEDFTTF